MAHKAITFVIMAILGCLYSFQASSRSYFLPDYQRGDDFYSQGRAQKSAQQKSEVSCESYVNNYSAWQPTMDCQSEKTHPNSTLSCYYCLPCPAEYQYSSADCPESSYTYGDKCGNKYNACYCRADVYTTTSSTEGCLAGYIPDIEHACVNKPSGAADTERYSCIVDVCYDKTTATDCQNSGLYCVGSDQCPGKCDECSVNYCQGMQQYENAISCDHGCAKPTDKISGCPELCKAGGSGCKICTPCSEEYNLDQCPNGGVCEACTGCYDEPKYKFLKCNMGYILDNGTCREIEGKIVYSSYLINPTLYIKGTDYTIDWGDGTIESPTTEKVSHKYATSGTRDISIYGNVTEFRSCFGTCHTGSAITKIKQLDLETVVSYDHAFENNASIAGSIPALPKNLKSASYMFDQCRYLKSSVPELPDSLEDASYMFRLCTSLTGSFPKLPAKLRNAASMFAGTGLSGTMPQLPNTLENADGLFGTGLTGSISTLPDSIISARGMFSGCKNLTGKIPRLPKKLQNGASMFESCSGLTGSIPALPDTLENADSMFRYCKKLTGSIPHLPDKIQSAKEMFNGCEGLTGKIPNIPKSLVNGVSMFESCEGLSGGIPELPSTLQKAGYMFRYCSRLNGSITNLPEGLISAKYMFQSDGQLSGDIPPIPSTLTEAEYMFSGCRNLTGTISAIPKALKSGNYMFSGCSKLTGSIPELPSAMSSGNSMFSSCSGLTGNVPTLPDTLKNGTFMFYGCSGLSGTTPPKPSALTSYKSMFTKSGVTLSSDWPTDAQ